MTTVSQVRSRLGGAVFGGVGIGVSLLAAVVGGRCPQSHQLGRRELDPAPGERMVDRLVLADRPAKDHPLAGIGSGAAERDRIGDQDALRVHAMQDLVEALAFLVDRPP